MDKAGEPAPFGGAVDPKLRPERADAVILGAPTDLAAHYRRGAAEGPAAIRAASRWIPQYSTASGRSLAELAKIADAGDVDLKGARDLHEINRRIKRAVERVLASGGLPVLLGGDHSITIPAAEAHGKKLGVIYFDAHPDILDVSGSRYGHGTVLRRLIDSGTVAPENIAMIGIREEEPAELAYMKKHAILHFDPLQVEDEGIEKITRLALSAAGRKTTGIYLSIDMDCLDAAFAPGVENPAPGGLQTREVMRAVRSIGPKMVGMDVTEVAPRYDCGDITARAAARFVLDALGAWAEARK